MTTAKAQTTVAIEKHKLPLKERCDEIAKIYIRHEEVEHAWSVLDFHLKHGLRLRETQTGYIIGMSRCGKTETMARFIERTTGKAFKRKETPQEGAGDDFEADLRRIAELKLPRHPPMFMQMVCGNGKRILYADMTNGVTPRIASRLILDGIFRFPKANTVTESEAGNVLAFFMEECHVDLFVIDEAQQMFRGAGTGAIGKYASWLLALENSGSFGIVVAGSPDLESALPNTFAANERKGGHARLMPFEYATPNDCTRFADLLSQFGNHLPFLSSPLTDRDLAYAFYYATRGRVGAIAKLCEMATTFAFKSEKIGVPTKLTLEDFAAAFDFGKLNDPRMKGANPFRERDLKKLPTIPLTVDGEMAEIRRAEAERLKAKRGRMRGSAIWD
jgi:hypothetical protein